MRMLLVAAPLLVLFLTGGCATALTVKAIYPGDERKTDDLTDVTGAWRDEAGNVTVCVYGLPAGANPWLGEGRNYSVVYPAASSLRLEIDYHGTIPRYLVTAADVGGACAPTMSGMIRIPVKSVDANEFGDPDYCKMSEDALAEFFVTRAGAPAVYMFNYSFGTATFRSYRMKVVYVHETAVFKEARAVELATEPRRLASRPIYILALPFALALDIISSPIQLLAMLTISQDKEIKAAAEPRQFGRRCEAQGNEAMTKRERASRSPDAEVMPAARPCLPGHPPAGYRPR